MDYVLDYVLDYVMDYIMDYVLDYVMAQHESNGHHNLLNTKILYTGNWQPVLCSSAICI